MAIVKCIQLTNAESRPSVKNQSLDVGATVRFSTFEFGPPNGEAAGSTIRFGILRKGWRLLGMRIASPNNFGAPGCTMVLGIPGNTSKFLSGGVDLSGESTSDCNLTIARSYGEVLAADVELVGTTAGAALLSATSSPVASLIKLTVTVRFISGD